MLREHKPKKVFPRVGWLGYLILCPLWCQLAHSHSDLPVCIHWPITLMSSGEDQNKEFKTVWCHRNCLTSVNSQTHTELHEIGFLISRSKVVLSQVPFINIETSIATWMGLLFCLYLFYIVYWFLIVGCLSPTRM